MKEFTGKVIKVGSSLAVTLPAKEAKNQNISQGDNVRFSYELVKDEQTMKQVSKEYEKFKNIYSSTLKNLSDR